MYEWIPVSILAGLVGLGLVGDTLESGRVERLREELHRPHDFPALAM